MHLTVGHFPAGGVTDLLADAERRYRAACARRRLVEKAWKDSGSPLLARGSQGQEVEHPLVTMLRAHDLLCLRLAVPLRQAHAGPQPSAVVKTGKITRLKVVPPTKPEPKASESG
jgi:hypothetical protein